MRKILTALVATILFSVLLPILLYGFTELTYIPLVALLSLPLFVVFGIPASIFIEKRNPRNGIVKFVLYIVAGLALGLIGHLFGQLFNTDFGNFRSDFVWFLAYGALAGLIYYGVTLIIKPKRY
ncbi:hypothetical protein [Bacillus testis]|uniref:hypothetical protein n=1 Tax=Bacillus testis TaxID=1622072 RepID=UPI00067ED37F|nr:hypothetical protein [Bacillus testis]